MSNLPYQQYTKLLGALANAKRIEIIRVLGDRCMTVSELIRMTGISQANISQHMQVLRRSSVVITKRNGKKITYCISHPNFINVFDLLHNILADRKEAKPLVKHTQKLASLHIVDPVCGMKVSPKYAAYSHEHKRTTYYFCAAGCKKAFIKVPHKYV